MRGTDTVRGNDFAGPAELGAVLIREGLIQACFLEHYFRFVVGRQARFGGSGDSDEAALATLESRFSDNGDDFLGLVLDLVSSEAFRHRVTEEN